MKVETNVDIECVLQCGDILGEVNLWCEQTQRLWWLDVRRPALQSYDPVTGRHEARRLHPDMLTGSMALREAGGFLLATNSGIYTYGPDLGVAPVRVADPIGGAEGMRLNDGKCDRAGRFWVGSMHDTRREPLGVLYRVDGDHSCHVKLEDFVLPNTICWNPDDTVMYFADTHNQLIWAFDFDKESGEISNRRLFKDWTHQLGRPDGGTVDAEGFLWHTMVATGHLIRLAPDGSVDRAIQLPVTNPTCPAFGGADLSTLYVTSHSQRMTPEQYAAEPLAGALFALDAGVKGVSEPRYAG